MNKRLLLVGATTGYQTRAFAAAAQRYGYELALATDRCHVLDDPWADGAIALRFEDPLGAAETLAAACAGAARADGIVALGDLPAYIAALAAERMGIPYNSPDSAAAARDKYLARERFRAAGLLVPDFYRVPLAEDPVRAAHQARYPCVLKPLGLSASRGVIRANNAIEFVAAFERIKKLLADPDIVRLHEDQNRFLQVESFIEGREFALEGIVSNGQLRVLAIFDKPDPLDGPFFEETIYVTPSRESSATQDGIIDATRRAVKALGLTQGPIHAEMRVNPLGVWMLEVAARPIGGLCARVLPGLEDLILCHAAGDDIAGGPHSARDGHIASDKGGALAMPTPAAGVMMIPIPREGIYVDVEGLDQARSEANIEDVIITAKQGQKLVPLPEGASYAGFIFARAQTPDAVERALRSCHAKLRFEIATALPVV